MPEPKRATGPSPAPAAAPSSSAALENLGVGARGCGDVADQQRQQGGVHMCARPWQSPTRRRGTSAALRRRPRKRRTAYMLVADAAGSSRELPPQPNPTTGASAPGLWPAPDWAARRAAAGRRVRTALADRDLCGLVRRLEGQGGGRQLGGAARDSRAVIQWAAGSTVCATTPGAPGSLRCERSSTPGRAL